MENEKKYTPIGEHYKYDKSGYCYYSEGKQDKNGNTYEETTLLSKHAPLLSEYRVLDNGFEVQEQVGFRPLSHNRLGNIVYLSVKDINGQTPFAAFGAAYRLEIGRGNLARYREFMQIQCDSIEPVRVYQHTGYAMVDGKRVYLNSGYSVTKEGLTDRYNVELPGQLENYCFSAEKNPERYKTLLSLLPTVAPKALIYAALGLSFLTPLNALLRDCGIEPCFILYFTGKTGTRKTTLAKLFLNFFGKFDNGTAPTANFRDTANAVEKKFALTDSTLVLLDDRIPSTTAKIRGQMESMEQAVARQIGDRSGRARMNADGTLKATYRPRCNLIITAEESFSNVGESAVARSISVELKPGDVNLPALTVVQGNAEHLNQCMSDYIQYVIAHWEDIKERVKPLFTDLRARAQSGGHGRLAECVAHLQIGIMFMCEWLQSENVIDAAQADSMKAAAWEVFMELAKRQNRRIVEEKPVKLFLDAVREMRDRGTIRIADTDAHSEFSSSSIIGYRDDNFYYFYPDSIYSEVKKFYMAQDKNFPLGKAALFQQMAVDNLIETDRGQTTKTKRIGGKRPRFLWLKSIALDNEQQEED